MWNANEENRSQIQIAGDEGRSGTRIIAVGIDKDKGSQHALKWALTNLFPVSTPSNTCILKLVHVYQRSPSSDSAIPRNSTSRLNQREPDTKIMEILLPFRCLCTRRQVQFDVDILEDHDIAHALIEYVSFYGVEILLLGYSSKSGLSRLFKGSEVASSVLKHVPDYCNVYLISKGKVNTLRNASRPVPPHLVPRQRPQTTDIVVSSSSSNGEANYDEMALPADLLDTHLESSARPSTDSNCLSFYNSFIESSPSPPSATPPSNLMDFENSASSSNLDDLDCLRESTSLDQEAASLILSQKIDEAECKMKRLKLEVKQTMEMYHAACKEALQAKQKVMELQQWKMKEEKRLQEARLAEETAMAVMEKEKAKRKAAIEAAEAARRVAEDRSKMLDLGFDLDLDLDLVLKYQSLYHILAVLFLIYFYFTIFYSFL